MATLALNTKDPFLLTPATGESFIIANLDLTNNVYIGPEIGLYGLQAGNLVDPTVDTLLPGSYVVLDGSEPIYGLAASGQPSVLVILGALSYWQPSPSISTGQFFSYSPSRGAGNLVASVSGTAGTDPYGNAFFAGVTEYTLTGHGYYAVNLDVGQLNIYTSTGLGGEAGPWTLVNSLAYLFGNGLTLTNQQDGGQIIISGLPKVTAAGIVSTSQLALTNGSAPALAAGFAELYADNGHLATVPPSGLIQRVSGAQLADMTQYTVTQAAATQASKIWSIPASDAEVGATYEFGASGSGVWGSTQQALTFALFIQGTSHIVTTVPATTFAINALFHWMFWVRFYCVSTGTFATWYPEHTLKLSPANQQTAWDITETLTALYTQSSLASQTVELETNWAAVTGAPTMTTVANWFRRVV